MEAAFNDKAAHQALGKLKSHQQLAIGAACCERMIPNYARFSSEEKWGDLSAVRGGLDFVWDSCFQGAIGGVDVEQQLASCEAVIPDADDFSSLYVSSAQEAVFAVCTLLEFLRDRDAERVVGALRFSTDSVDLMVQEQESLDPRDPLLERKIVGHPLMQQELLRQRRDISEATRLLVGETTAWLAFRQRAAIESNLALAECR